MQNINQDLLNAITVILTAIITSVGAVVSKYYVEKRTAVKQQTAQIQNDSDRSLANAVINDVDELIQTNVIAVENTMKDAILKGISEGKYDKESLKTLGAEVLTRVKAQLAESSMIKLQEIRKDVDGYISNRIEEILAKLKDSRSDVVKYTTIPEVKAEVKLEKTTGQSTNMSTEKEMKDESPIKVDIIPGAANASKEVSPDLETK